MQLNFLIDSIATCNHPFCSPFASDALIVETPEETAAVLAERRAFVGLVLPFVVHLEFETRNLRIDLASHVRHVLRVAGTHRHHHVETFLVDHLAARLTLIT